MQCEAEIDLFEVMVVGQDRGDAEFAHHCKTGQIGEGDTRFIPIAKAELPGFLETLRGDALNDEIVLFCCRPEPFHKLPSFCEGTAAEEPRHGFVENVVGGHGLTAAVAEFPVVLEHPFVGRIFAVF